MDVLASGRTAEGEHWQPVTDVEEVGRSPRRLDVHRIDLHDADGGRFPDPVPVPGFRPDQSGRTIRSWQV